MFGRLRKNSSTIAFISILILTAFLSFYAAWNEGYANTYYTAAVKSMLSNAHNFFFASFDPGGYITVDKPALGLWLQALPASIFGVQGWSVILTESLFAVGSVAVLHHLVKRKFGSAAGLIAALVLAVTPVFIAVSRTNNLDSSLIFVLLLAVWALMVAAEKGSLKLLILSMALVGLGFNIKMLQAYMVLPAMCLVYFFTAPCKWGRRVWHLAVSVVVLVVVSLSWSIAVDLTPAEKRPYVGGSGTNSEIELALGYNGIQRVLPGSGGPGGMGIGRGMRQDGIQGGPGMGPDGGGPGDFRQDNNFASSSKDGTRQNWGTRDSQKTGPQSGNINNSASAAQSTSAAQNGNNAQGNGAPQGGGMPGSGSPQSMRGNGGMPGGGMGGSGFDSTGQQSVFRLFNEGLAGQISWLLPMVLFGFIALFVQPKRTALERMKNRRMILLWAGWLIPMIAYFCISGFFHRYYLAMLAPAIAAMCGIGIPALWRLYREDHKAWFLLPLSILLTGAAGVFILTRYTAWSTVLIPILCVLAGGASLALVAIKIVKKAPKKMALICAAIGVAALLMTPSIWSFTPILYGSNNTMPYAGPDLNRGGGMGRGFDGGGVDANNGTSSSGLIQYLLENNNGEKYLAATGDANSAAPIILATGKPVMAIGGFSGNDAAITLDQFKELVAKGELRYYIASGRGGSGEIANWAEQNGKLVESDTNGLYSRIYDLKQKS